MGMFTRSLDAQPFGTLSTEGQSNVWEGKIDVPYLGNGFDLRVHGTKAGPTRAQVEAFWSLKRNAPTIKEEATSALVEFLHESEVVPADMLLTATTLWDFLKPCFLEVHFDDYLGEEHSACAVGYSIPWEQDHLVHIHIVNGKFDAVHSE